MLRVRTSRCRSSGRLPPSPGAKTGSSPGNQGPIPELRWESATFFRSLPSEKGLPMVQEVKKEGMDLGIVCVLCRFPFLMRGTNDNSQDLYPVMALL